MSRVKFAEPSAEEVAARLRDGHQPPPNLQKVVANAPEVAKKQYELLRAISDKVDLRVKEMVILVHAKLTSNTYCWGHHVPVGMGAGLTKEQVLGIRGDDYSSFDGGDRAVIDYVLAAAQRKVTDAVWERVAKGRTDEELICLTMLIGYYDLQATAWAALQVPQDDGFGGFEAP